MKNRRRHPRYETEIEAIVYTADLNLPVTVVDISDEGIGIISKKPIKKGDRVFISVFPISKDPIIGSAVWSVYVEKDQKYYNMIGIESENLALERIKTLGFPKRSAFLSEIISQMKKDKSQG